MTRRAVKDPPPDVACGTCRVALYFAGSPDADRQRVAFTRDHPPGNGHRWVRKLPDDHGDVAWGWTPGAQKRVSAASAQRTPETEVAAVLARSRVAAERITTPQGGGL